MGTMSNSFLYSVAFEADVPFQSGKGDTVSFFEAEG